MALSKTERCGTVFHWLAGGQSLIPLLLALPESGQLVRKIESCRTIPDQRVILLSQEPLGLGLAPSGSDKKFGRCQSGHRGYLL